MPSEVFIVIDDSTSKTITGVYEFDSESGGKISIPSGTSFPSSPMEKELFWRTDERKLYRRNNGNTAWESVIAELPTIPALIQESHLVTSGEVAAGYFTLNYNPIDPNSVLAIIWSGSMQMNKGLVGSTGANPDYEIRNTNQFHINNNGGASGLSGDIQADVVVQISYTIAVSI